MKLEERHAGEAQKQKPDGKEREPARDSHVTLSDAVLHEYEEVQKENQRLHNMVTELHKKHHDMSIKVSRAALSVSSCLPQYFRPPTLNRAAFVESWYPCRLSIGVSGPRFKAKQWGPLVELVFTGTCSQISDAIGLPEITEAQY